MVATSTSVMLTIARNARVVDEAIHPPEPFDGLVDHRLDIRLIRHVRANETNADLFLERAAFLLAPPDDHDLGSFRDKGLGDAFADAARASGHDRNLPVQCTHGPPLIG